MSRNTSVVPKFSMGQIVATPGALEALGRDKLSATTLLDRHVAGDWGDCGPEDSQANDWSLANEARIFSVYKLATTF